MLRSKWLPQKKSQIALMPQNHYSLTNNMSTELLRTLLCAKTLLCFQSRAGCGDLAEIKMLAVDGHTKDPVLQTTKASVSSHMVSYAPHS